MNEETSINTSAPAEAEATARKESSGVFKSKDIAPQKMNRFTNSVVSDKAVERDPEQGRGQGLYIGPEQETAEGGVYVGPEQAAVDGGVYVGPSDQPGDNSVHIGAEPEVPVDPIKTQMEELQQSMAEVEQMRQSIEQRQAEVDQKMREAEVILEKIARISETLNVDDQLRKRIEATIARTRGLRRTIRK